MYVSGGGVLFRGGAGSKRIFCLEFAIVLHVIINFMHPSTVRRNAVAHASIGSFLEKFEVSGHQK